MPDYAGLNALDARRPLPWFYWSGETEMACLRQVIRQTRDLAYAHHIQRLMVTGNFALIAGLDPVQVNEWYMVVFADAYEWVELPNTHGLAIHADVGITGSKHYAASGAYINRMSDYCAGCRYDPAERVGDDACPYNALYWDFLARHRDLVGDNPRLKMPYRNWDRIPRAQQHAIRERAATLLARLDEGPTGPPPACANALGTAPKAD